MIIGRQEDWHRTSRQHKRRPLHVEWFGRRRVDDDDIEPSGREFIRKPGNWRDFYIANQALLQDPLHLHRNQILVFSDEDARRRCVHGTSFCQARFMGPPLMAVI